MVKKKESPPSGNYTKEGELLVDSAKRLSDSSDVVNIVANLIQYNILLTKLYRKNMRVK